jgi:hypothetical protein
MSEERDHLIEAVLKRFGSSDFDDHVHELKGNEAAAINNSGPRSSSSTSSSSVVRTG